MKRGGITPYLAEFMERDTVKRASRLAGVKLEVEGHMLLLGVDVYREAAGRVLNHLVEVVE